jgi:hypothetical protein
VAAREGVAQFEAARAEMIELSGRRLLDVTGKFERREQPERIVLVEAEVTGEIANAHLRLGMKDFEHAERVRDGLNRVFALGLAGRLRHQGRLRCSNALESARVLARRIFLVKKKGSGGNGFSKGAGSRIPSPLAFDPPTNSTDKRAGVQDDDRSLTKEVLIGSGRRRGCRSQQQQANERSRKSGGSAWGVDP